MSVRRFTFFHYQDTKNSNGPKRVPAGFAVSSEVRAERQTAAVEPADADAAPPI
jgi:hypothetical protein